MARDSGVTVVARRDGVVESVDAGRIVVKADVPTAATDVASEVDIYNLIKFQRSNQNTCINQKPIVKHGRPGEEGRRHRRRPGHRDGRAGARARTWWSPSCPGGATTSRTRSSSPSGSSRRTSSPRSTSRSSSASPATPSWARKRSPATSPTSARRPSRTSTSAGIIRIGAEVKPGDILVGKITPKGETQLSPEEKLLRAIFGEKAGDVRDSSLRVPPGVEGTVIDAKVFSRKGVEKDERAKAIEDAEEAKLLKDQNDEIQHHPGLGASSSIRKLLAGKEVAAQAGRRQGRAAAQEGRRPHRRAARHRPASKLLGRDRRRPARRTCRTRSARSSRTSRSSSELVKLLFGEKIGRLKKGDELPPGVIKMVKVYVAIKRKLAVGDKMAGRHGNKGVVSRILPEEDMPYLEDGRPVDIVLNPLGVPSRMNVGQILETHLGLGGHAASASSSQEMHRREADRGDAAQEAARRRSTTTRTIGEFIDDAAGRRGARARARSCSSGIHVATPVFDGAREDGDPARCSTRPAAAHRARSMLFDGRTGEPFDQRRHRRRHVHAEAAPPGGRQDPRPLHRALLARHPAAAGRQGPVRRPAPRRDGSLGDGGLRRGLRAAGVPHRQVRRRGRPHPDVRGHRQGREHAGVGPARVLQRADQGAPVPGARRRAAGDARGREGPRAGRGRGRPARPAPRPRRPPRRGTTRNPNAASRDQT